MIPTPDPLTLVLLAVAVWRLSALLCYERGPFDVFMRLRTAAGIVHDDDGDPVARVRETWLSGVLFCVWCCSLNVAILLACAWLLAPDGVRLACVPFALSAGAIALERLLHG